MNNYQKKITDLVPRNPILLKVFPQLREKSAQAFMILTLTLVALILFGVFAISPTISTIIELRKQISDSKDVYQKLEKKRENFSLLYQQYQEIEPDLPYVFNAIPQTPQSSLFIGKLNSIASSMDVKIQQLQTYPVEIIPPSDDPDSSTSFDFNLNVVGSDNSIFNFLSTLGNFDRIITIDSLSINKNSQSSNSAELTIKGKTYFKRL